MASAPSEPRPVLGRLDRSGRLIAADPELEALQREAGSRIGQMLALPQVAAVAQLARKLGTPVGRPAIAASAEHDIELWVNAKPEGDEIALSLEGWTVRPAAGPRLAIDSRRRERSRGRQRAERMGRPTKSFGSSRLSSDFAGAARSRRRRGGRSSADPRSSAGGR